VLSNCVLLRNCSALCVRRVMCSNLTEGCRGQQAHFLVLSSALANISTFCNVSSLKGLKHFLALALLNSFRPVFLFPDGKH
jgi:hypothetical protein